MSPKSYKWVVICIFIEIYYSYFGRRINESPRADRSSIIDIFAFIPGNKLGRSVNYFIMPHSEKKGTNESVKTGVINWNNRDYKLEFVACFGTIQGRKWKAAISPWTVFRVYGLFLGLKTTRITARALLFDSTRISSKETLHECFTFSLGSVICS